MDKIIKHVFESEGMAGMPVKHESGNYNTLLKGNLAVDVNGDKNIKKLTMAQSMTYLGRSTVVMGSGSSDLEGINKFCLTPEGNLNIVNVLATVAKESGMPLNEQHHKLEYMKTMSWADNHVSLLVNLMRFAILLELSESSGGVGLKGALPKYNDGVVAVNRTALLPEEYPVGGDMTWFTRFSRQDMPDVVRIEEYCAPQSDVSLDLRSLTETEAVIVLLCCGKWYRQSRFLLDFDCPILTSKLYYRFDKRIDIGNFDQTSDGRVTQPKLPQAKEVWRTLSRYIATNRLYGQYSTALCLVAQTMCQFIPATAEGNVWLTQQRVLHLPGLKSVRGALPFINEDEPALVSQRSLNEWGAFSTDVTKYNLLGNILVQAVQTGIAVRALRFRNEDNPEDLYRTYDTVTNPAIMYGALCSEALRCPVPLAGMSGVFVEFELPDEREEVELEFPVLVYDQKRCGSTIEKRRDTEYLQLDSIPMAGVPTLLLPLNPIGKVSPFNLRGVFDTADLKRTKMGWETDLYSAWSWAWLCRLCGYDIQMRQQYGQTCGSQGDYSPDASWTWPILGSVGHNGIVCISKLVERGNSFIDLPPLHSKSCNSIINYKFSINSHSVSLLERKQPELIGDRYSAAPVLNLRHINIATTTEIIKLKGFIERSESDFRFADDVLAGQIPPPEVPHVASDVIE
uniref:Capsid protein n=1 Tax=Red clover powdery mildew-associated totivirus 1 TaxID=1714362 RepID=A0A0S3Q2C3_9VIRU|nr:capsid protein [Red clover powdery mildew-associated totivirus 1]